MNYILEYNSDSFNPIKSFEPQKELCKDVWVDDKIYNDIRVSLLNIAYDFYSNTKLKNNIVDIVLCGSLANYNWSYEYSDYDLHIIIDFKEYNIDEDFMLKFCTNASSLWNTKHNIIIKGFDTEVNIQDKIDLKNGIKDNKIGGVYSLLKNRWIKRPKYKNFEIKDKIIKKKSGELMSQIDYYNSLEKYTVRDVKEIQDLYKRVRSFRKNGLNDLIRGEYATGNLIFKLLRRNGYLQILKDLMIKSKDSMMVSSINEANVDITTKNIDDMFKNIFNKNGVAFNSIDSVYEKTDYGYKLILALNGLVYDNTNVIHTKFIFHTNESKLKIIDNYFIYLYDINCIYHEIEFSNITDIEDKIINILKSNNFGEDIRIISDLMGSPIMFLDYYLKLHDIQDYSIFDVKYNPKFKIIECDKMTFDFDININDDYMFSVSLHKYYDDDKKMNVYSFQFKFMNDIITYETDTLKNLHFTIGDNIAKILNDKLKNK